MTYVLNCSSCGRFMTSGTWASIFDFAAMEPSHDVDRCPVCTERFGPAVSNAKPYNGDMRPYEGIVWRGEYICGRPDHPEIDAEIARLSPSIESEIERLSGGERL